MRAQWLPVWGYYRCHTQQHRTVATCVMLLQVSHTATLRHSGDLCDVTTGVKHSSTGVQWLPVWCYCRCYTQQHWGTGVMQITPCNVAQCLPVLWYYRCHADHTMQCGPVPTWAVILQVPCRSHHAMWPSAYLCCDTAGAMPITPCNVAQCLPVLWYCRCHADHTMQCGPVPTCAVILQVPCRSHHAMWPSAYLCCDTAGAMPITPCNVAQCLPVLWYCRCHADHTMQCGPVPTCAVILQVPCRSHHAMWPSAYLCCDTAGAMQAVATVVGHNTLFTTAQGHSIKASVWLHSLGDQHITSPVTDFATSRAHHGCPFCTCYIPP